MDQTTLDLQHKVQTALFEDRRTKDYNVEILDNNGIVTLRGRVPSREASALVESMVREVAGVVSVINELDVM